MPQRQHTTTPIPPRASDAYQGATTRQFDTETSHEQPAASPKQGHWLTPVGCGAVLVLGAVIVWSWVIVPTYQNVTDHWNYGNSHIAGADIVMNGQSERFISFDDRGHITVIEIPDAHPDKSRIYQAAQLVGDDSTNRIVTVTFTDVNHDGKTDLVIHVEGEQGYVVLFQTANGFTWQQ